MGISNDAMRFLTAYSWPGNVRELRSVFEYAFVTCQNSMIQPHHFPAGILQADAHKKQPPKSALNKKEIKKYQLIDALKKSNGNQSKAADLLGISRVTVWNRMKKYNISLNQYKEMEAHT